MMSPRALACPEQSGLNFHPPASYKAQTFQHINRTEHMDNSKHDRIGPADAMRGMGVIYDESKAKYGIVKL